MENKVAHTSVSGLSAGFSQRQITPRAARSQPRAARSQPITGWASGHTGLVFHIGAVR